MLNEWMPNECCSIGAWTLHQCHFHLPSHFLLKHCFLLAKWKMYYSKDEAERDTSGNVLGRFEIMSRLCPHAISLCVQRHSFTTDFPLSPPFLWTSIHSSWSFWHHSHTATPWAVSSIQLTWSPVNLCSVLSFRLQNSNYIANPALGRDVNSMRHVYTHTGQTPVDEMVYNIRWGHVSCY